VHLPRPVALALALAGVAATLATGSAAAASATGAQATTCRSEDAVASTGWAGLRAATTGGSLTLSGVIDYASAATGTSAWLSVGGGGRSLDLIQVGMHDCGTGPRYFAAWGSGAAGAAGSTYEEVDLGAADLRPHAFSLALSSGTWRIGIDGRTVRTVDDGFRTWDVKWIQSMTESHTGRMPGVTVSRLSTSLDGSAAAPVFGYTAVGAPALAARLTISRDGFTVAAR
jgi:hypothetical protein